MAASMVGKQGNIFNKQPNITEQDLIRIVAQQLASSNYDVNNDGQ